MNLLKIGLLGLISLLSLNSLALKPPSFFSIDTNLDILPGVFVQQNQENIGNPNNEVFYLPNQSWDLELKPSIKVSATQYNFNIVLNPRVRFSSVEYKRSDGAHRREIGDYGFWESYVRWELMRHVDVSMGIINTQWGPSDILSPSQFMFPDLLIRPEPFQSTQGLELAELQWTPNQNLSVTSMMELEPFQWEHSDALPAHKIDSKKRLLFRGEFSADSGAFAIGVVFGKKTTDIYRPQYGAYSFWNYTDYTQIYFDFLVQQGSERFRIDDNGIVNRPSSNSGNVYSLGLMGHRFTFSNGLDWHVEFIYNGFGQSVAERSNTYAWIRAGPLNTQYLTALNDPSSPLPGTQYLYNSIRWDNAPALEGFFSSSHIYLKHIYSLGDQSQLWNLGVETSLSRSLSQSFALVNTIGNTEDELSSFLISYLSYYLKYSF